MAWSTTKDAFHMLTGITHAGGALNGAKGIRQSKQVVRNIINSDGEKGPTGRPVQSVDATAVARFLDLNSIVDEDTAAGNLVASFTKANGNSGSITQNSMLGGSWDFDGENADGGMAVQQIFEVEGSTLTITISQ